jgi:hypothetical protein
LLASTERNYGNAPFLRRRQTRQGLAPIQRETNKSGDQTVESGRIMITDAGRRALEPLIGPEGSMSESRSRNACPMGRRWRAGGRISPHAAPALHSEELRQGPGASSARLKVLILAVNIYRMAKNPEPSKDR